MNLKEIIEAGLYSKKKLELLHAYDIEQKTPDAESVFELPTKKTKRKRVRIGRSFQQISREGLRNEYIRVLKLRKFLNKTNRDLEK